MKFLKIYEQYIKEGITTDVDGLLNSINDQRVDFYAIHLANDEYINSPIEHLYDDGNFNNQLFKDMNEFQEKVDSILTRQNKQCPNLAKIKQYIIANYDLDDNVEHRIQFSNILNEVIKGLNVAPEFYEMMKKSLPLVLAELNLNKKRYSSGFFWYGLVRKNESSGGNINTIIEDEKEGKIRTEHKYNELIKERGYDT